MPSQGKLTPFPAKVILVGEANRKQYNREQFLKEHPWCCYCGAPATTTDHCPPRALFYGRRWPEGYEFPACAACNDATRRDEQVAAVLAKLWSQKNLQGLEADHWDRIFNGLRNNQPDIIAEWRRGTSRAEQMSAFRRLYGAQGDAIRRLGYGIIRPGNLTNAALDRFGIKLCKALFYKHTRQILDGEVWMVRLSLVGYQNRDEIVQALTSITPFTSRGVRGREVLDQQFYYAYNFKNDATPVIYASVQFTDQMIYSIGGMSRAFLSSVERPVDDDKPNMRKFDAARKHFCSEPQSVRSRGA